MTKPLFMVTDEHGVEPLLMQSTQQSWNSFDQRCSGALVCICEGGQFLTSLSAGHAPVREMQFCRLLQWGKLVMTTTEPPMALDDAAT